MSEKDWTLINGLALAYMGDAAYEVFIRQHLMERGWTKPNDLHRRATHYVSAKSQARLMHAMLAKPDFLNEEEVGIYKRGRNAKSHTIAKNADVASYRMSTGFEAVMGFLHLSQQHERLSELVQWCIDQVEGEPNES